MDDEGNKDPKTMDDNDLIPDAQKRHRKESGSSDSSDEDSGGEDFKRKKRRTKKIQISILISVRKLMKQDLEAPMGTPTLNVINVDAELDFHIEMDFYKVLMEKAKRTLHKGKICKQMDQEKRPNSLEVPGCTYQVTKDKYDKIPMPTSGKHARIPLS